MAFKVPYYEDFRKHLLGKLGETDEVTLKELANIYCIIKSAKEDSQCQQHALEQKLII